LFEPDELILKAGVLSMNVKELAQLGREGRIPQLLARRAYGKSHPPKVDPVAQAIAYSDACIRRRWELAMASCIFLVCILTIGLTLGAIEEMTPGTAAARLYAGVGLLVLFSAVGSFTAVVHIACQPLPAKDVAETFAKEIGLIQQWSDKPFWFWPINHFGLKKLGEVILATQGAKIDRAMRDLQNASDGASKVVTLVKVGHEESSFKEKHALLLKHEMADADGDYYREKGRELLAKQDRQASLMAEYHELNRVSLEERTDESSPSDAGLAALAPAADELPEQR
jgi:hypothetical protein